MNKFTIIGTQLHDESHLYVTSEKASLDLVREVSMIVHSTSRFSIYKDHVECAYNGSPESLLSGVKSCLSDLKQHNRDGNVLEIQTRINRLKEYISIVES
jgi:hypothetical protein